MQEKEEQGFNLDSISNRDDFQKLENKFVSIKDYVDITDDENITLEIKFNVPISKDSVDKKNFTVIQRDDEKDFSLEEIKTNDDITGVRIVTENELNYADEIQVTVSKEIKSAEDEKFTMAAEREITFIPKAPTVFIKNLQKTISEGKTVIKGELKNNSTMREKYVLILGIYSDDNEMVSRSVASGMIDAGETIDIHKTLESTDNNIEGTLITGIDDFKILNSVIVE